MGEMIQQHLIDPEICIRCNTCEATCPVGAITHDDRNYVVDASKCNLCMACVPPCPTGSIDNWREVLREQAYSLEEQLGWDSLPSGDAAPLAPPPAPVYESAGSTIPPWSAAQPSTNLYRPDTAITATVSGNVRVTEVGETEEGDYDTHHIVLDFGKQSFPVLEGQSLGVIPPGVDAQGKTHYARQYSIASPRDGERPGYNNLSLTIKRVLQDHEGRPVKGVASNFMCDLQVGDKVQVIGPFGASFLMPNHGRSNIVMICTGTGSAPMRAMTEWRRRLAKRTGSPEPGKLMLFFGARRQEELPYFGPLQNLPKDFIDINFAFSRTPGEGKRYVQDAMRDRAADLGELMKDPNTYVYVCGLRAMEEGVLQALRDIAGAEWTELAARLKREGRLHLETY